MVPVLLVVAERPHATPGGAAGRETTSHAVETRMPAASKKTSSRRAAPRKTTSRKKTPSAAKTSANSTVEWTGALDVTRATALEDEIASALSANEDVTIEAHEVSATDLAIVQVLLAAVHTAKRDGKRLRLDDPGAELEAVCQELGFGATYHRLTQPDAEVTA